MALTPWPTFRQAGHRVRSPRQLMPPRAVGQPGAARAALLCALGQGHSSRSHDCGAGGAGRNSGRSPVRTGSNPAGEPRPAARRCRLSRAREFSARSGHGRRRRIAELKLHEFALTDGAVLETGCVYIVPLIESLALPADIAASTNPKSSTGRLDVFTRVIADETRGFDRVEGGYRGPLYAEISPKTFPVLVREGSRLSQIRFRHGDAALGAEALAHAACARAAGRPRRSGDGRRRRGERRSCPAVNAETGPASSAIAPSAIPPSSRSSAAPRMTSPISGSRSRRAPTRA